MPVDRHTQPVRTAPRFPFPWVRLLLRQGTHLERHDPTSTRVHAEPNPSQVAALGWLPFRCAVRGAMSASIRTRYLFMELPIAERTERQRNCGTTERVVVARSTNTVLPTGGKATRHSGAFGMQPILPRLDADYFWAKVEVSGPEECWLWTGERRLGYGILGRPRVHRIYAHRASWVLANQQEIPAGMCVCHRCDNPLCINPAHLFLGTPSDNAKDMWNKGRGRAFPGADAYSRARKGEDHPMAILSEADVKEIRRLSKEEGLKPKQLAAMFGVSQVTAWNIVTNRSWKHVGAN